MDGWAQLASSFVISFAGFHTGDFLLIEFGRHEITSKKHRWLKRDRATNRSNTREQSIAETRRRKSIFHNTTTRRLVLR
uniref:Uncharacterized protein n=1 Tax=Pristionchus pacificus TaxID=54126 RepID=A0A2A6C9P8_PRIPA|eukprot:PDM74751.1 hypothetical protein PRIPAC_43702 [Pristionchus pacificus]